MKLRIATGMISVLLLCSAIQAEDLKFDIASQPVSDALNEFARQSGLQVVIDWGDGAGVTTRPLLGDFTPQAALSQLLAGTGLAFDFLNERTVAVGPESRQGESKGAQLLSPESAGASLQLAQTEDASDAQSPNRPSSESTGGGSESAAVAQPTRVEEIVVTAQKREQRLIDTPISVGVLTGASLDRGSSRGVIDALSQIGGVSVSEPQPGQTRIAVRGIAGGVASGPTGFYLDEVPFAFVRTSILPDANAFDLARVEVLRGAQGTLYGANSLGGVVRVLTNDANLNAFEAKGRLRTSRTQDADDNFGGDMAINLPLIPGKLAVRAVASYSDLTGYIDSTASGGIADGGRGINDSRARSYRVRVNAQPSDNFNVKLGFTRSNISNDASAEAFDDFTTLLSSNRPSDYLVNTYNLIAQYDWPHVSLLSSTGYVDYDGYFADEISLAGIRSVPAWNPLTSFTQEFRLTSDFDGPWQWSLGAMYKDTAERQIQDARTAANIGFTTVYRIKEISESYAIFGETTRSFLNSRFEITGGLRYFQDDYLQTQQANFFPGTLAPDLPLEFDELTWRLVASYKPQEEMRFYGSISTGFRSGIGQSPATLVSQPQFQGVVEPDTVLTYEIGAKGRLLGGTLTYETAVYYMKWEDIAQSLGLPIGFAARVNAGNASGPGAEVTLSYQPVSALTLHTGIGWNDLTFDQNIFQHVGAAAPLGTDVLLFGKDGRINDSAEWTGSVGGTFRTATPMTGVDFVLSSNFTYGSARDRRFVSGGVLRISQSDAFDLLTASIGLATDRWSLDLYGENLLNERGRMDSPQGNFLLSQRHRPRTIGLQATFDY